MNKRYKVVQDYHSYYYGFPMVIKAGSVGEWFESADVYIFAPAIAGYVPCVAKWAVEAWNQYFEEVVS